MFFFFLRTVLQANTFYYTHVHEGNVFFFIAKPINFFFHGQIITATLYYDDDFQFRFGDFLFSFTTTPSRILNNLFRAYFAFGLLRASKTRKPTDKTRKRLTGR